MLESHIEGSRLRDGCRARGLLCLKLSFWKGIPDRLVIGPKRRVVFVETKTPVGSLSKPQKIVHKTLGRWGFTVLVLASVADVESFFTQIDEGRL